MTGLECAGSSWSTEVWKKASKVYEAILRQAFLKELSDGSLSRDAFSRYIAQDEIYLKNYYHQMHMLADLMDDQADKALFLSFAQSGMEGEKVLHEYAFWDYGYNAEDGVMSTLPSRRVQTRNTHGTGCTLSSAFAATLAKGEDLTSAARSAKTFIEKAIIFGADCVTGAGHGPVNHGFEPIKMIINENR